MSIDTEKLNETTTKVLKPLMTDYIIHPWLYNISGYVLMQRGDLKIHHDDSCLKCREARRVHNAWLEVQ